MAAAGCATAHSRPLSVTMPFPVVAFVDRAMSAIENGAATATPAVVMTTCTLMLTPGCSVGETVLPIVAGITLFAVMNAMEVMVPALAVSDAIVYASGTLPEFAFVNVRGAGVPAGKRSALRPTAGSLAETAIAETAATET